MTNTTIDIPITLNGRATHLRCSAPTQTLLHALNAAGHTGTKEGCGDGDCGACTVALLHRDCDGITRALAVNSCLIPTAQLAGAQLVTVEGLQTLNHGSLHPTQSALVTHGGSQCGYCTPGFVMSLFAAFHSAEKAIDDAVVEGNLCRCTGYTNIRRAMAELLAAPVLHLAPLPEPATSEPATSGPATFADTPLLRRPGNLLEALALKHATPEAQWLAGATDLGLEFSRAAQHPKPLIAIDALPELNTLHITGNCLEIGAGVSLSRLQWALRGKPQNGDVDLSGHRNGLRTITTMLHWFAATQVRNRATLGGNLGTASPIGDLLPVLLALDGVLVLQSVRGERLLAAADYFLGYRQTQLSSDELVRCVRINLTGHGTRRLNESYKVGKRGSDDISIVAACFVLDLDPENRIVHARLAYGGIAAVPIRAMSAEAQLIGQIFRPELGQMVRPMLEAAFNPLTDFRGSAEYRKRLILNLFDKFLAEMGAQL